MSIASHKGGTGRTTVAALLAWALGRDGVRVALSDASIIPSLDLLCGPPGETDWENVQLLPPGTDPKSVDCDVVLVDSPSLVEQACVDVLVAADGVMLTMLVEPMTVRTIASAEQAIAVAREACPELQLIGMVLNQVDPSDPIQSELLEDGGLESAGRTMEPRIPLLPELSAWAMTPGAPPPGEQASMLAAHLAKTVAKAAGLRREPSYAGVRAPSRTSRYLAEMRAAGRISGSERKGLFQRIRRAVVGS